MGKKLIIPVIAFMMLAVSVQAIDLTITSPENTTYPITSISLNWSGNETSDYSSYSLNSGSNVSLHDIFVDIETAWTCSAWWSNAANTVDENWNTYGDSGYTGGGYLYENMSSVGRPLAANWSFKFAWSGSGTYNDSCWFRVACMNYSSNGYNEIYSNKTWSGSHTITETVLNDCLISNKPLQIRTQVYGTSESPTNRCKTSYYEGRVLWIGDSNTTITAAEGTNNIIVYANTTSDILNSSTVYFTVDTTAPYYANVTNPGTITEGNGFIATIDTNDTTSNVDSVYVEFDGTNTSLSYSGTESTWTTVMTAPGVYAATNYNLTYFMNDTFGYSNSTYITFEVEPAASGGSEGGGGIAVTPDNGICAEFQVYPSGRIELFSTEGVESPEVEIFIINGNATQTFGVGFDRDVLPYCKFTQYPQSSTPPNAQTAFAFTCRVPPEVIFGNVIITTTTGCEVGIPLTIGPAIGFVAQFGDFIRLLAMGDWDSFLIAYHGVPLIVFITFIAALLFLLYRW